MNIGDIFYTFRGESRQLVADAKKAGDTAGRTLGERIRGQLTRANVGMAVGAAIGAAGVAAMDMGFRYAAAMDTVRVSTGAVGDELRALEADFASVAQQVPDDLGLVGEVLGEVHRRTGQTGEGLRTLTRRIIDLSRITRTDAVRNVGLVTRLFGDWSIATEDQAETLDKLLRASQATGTTIDSLADSVVQFGSPLRLLGFDLEEAIALFGQWEQEGVNVQTALPGLRFGLKTLVREGVAASDMAEEFRARLDAIGASADPVSDAIRLFGVRAGPDLAAAIIEGRFAIDDLVDHIAHGEDTVDQATRDVDGLSEAWRRFKNTLATVVGPAFAEIGDIGHEMGNLVFLLPALGGALGRGIGFLAPKLGTTFGRLFGLSAAAAILAFLGAELVKQWEQVGEQVERVASLPERVRAGAFSLTEMEAELANTQAAIDEIRRVTGIAAGKEGEGIVLFPEATGLTAAEELRAALIEQIEAVHAGVRSAAADPQTREAFVAAFTPPVEEIEAEVAILVANLEDEMDELGDGLDGAADDALALDAALQLVATRGLRAVRGEARSAEEQWKKLIATGDGNRKAIERLNEEIDRWERRYTRALKRNDSEAAAFALAQSRHLTGERDQRQEVVDMVAEQHRVLARLPETTTTTVDVEISGEQRARNLFEFLRSRTLSDYKASVVVTGAGGGNVPRRQHGGPVAPWLPYWVGEAGRELFVPERAGRIVPEADVGAAGDTYHIDLDLHGQPMRAETPLEVLRELRRGLRFGTLRREPRLGWGAG